MHSLNTMFRINQQRADEARRAKLQRDPATVPVAAFNAAKQIMDAAEQVTEGEVKPLDVLFSEYEIEVLKPQAA